MTSLKSIQAMMLPLIPDDYKTDIETDIDLCVYGSNQASVLINKQFTILSERNTTDDGNEIVEYSIEEDLNSFEIYLCAMCSYKAYLIRLKDEFNRDAINFKTLTFEIKSLEKRPEAINDSIYSINKDINSLVSQITGSNSLCGVAKMFSKNGYFN